MYHGALRCSGLFVTVMLSIIVRLRALQFVVVSNMAAATLSTLVLPLEKISDHQSWVRPAFSGAAASITLATTLALGRLR